MYWMIRFGKWRSPDGDRQSEVYSVGRIVEDLDDPASESPEWNEHAQIRRGGF